MFQPKLVFVQSMFQFGRTYTVMSYHHAFIIKFKAKIPITYVRAFLHKCLIKHALVQTLCPTISACLFQALSAHTNKQLRYKKKVWPR